MKLAENDCLKFLKKNNGYLTGIAGNEMPFMRRQDLPVVYKPNGAIYIISREKFVKYGSFMTGRTVEFVMDSDSSHDVDVWNDVKIIEKVLDERREKILHGTALGNIGDNANHLGFYNNLRRSMHPSSQ